MDAAGVAKRALVIAGILLLVGTPTCYLGGANAFFGTGVGANLGLVAFFLGAGMLVAGAIAVVVSLGAFIAWLVHRP